MATVTIRLDDETRDRITAAAEDRGVTTSNYIREVLNLHLTLEQSGEIGASRPESGEEIPLTLYQRKVLQLLHRITLATHNDLNPSHYDPEEEVRSIQVLEGGFTADYAQEFADINESITRSECELVWDIFDMFRVIENSVAKLGKDGWSQLNLEDAELHGRFHGFDLNDSLEARLLIYARYLVKSDRWTEQSEAFSRENDRGNSHMQMLPTYRAMLRVFKPLWHQASRGGQWHLSQEDLEQILLAAPGAQAASK